MSIQIQISRSLDVAPENRRSLRLLLQQAIRVALQSACSQEKATISLVLSDDAQLQELNRQYLGIDAPTDVLSFPSGEIDPETQQYYLGDVLISYPRAISQADAGGHPLEAEVQLLVVHGVLHLCGYDHGEPDEKAKMWQLQAEILRQLNSRILGPAGE